MEAAPCGAERKRIDVLFAAICLDKPGHADLRLATRAEHLAFLGAHAPHVKLAGPFVDANGQATGSLLILDCADAKEAQALLDADPYTKAGLFASVELRAWKRVLGAEL